MRYCSTKLPFKKHGKTLACSMASAVALIFSTALSAENLRDIYDLAVKNDAKWLIAASKYDADLQTEKLARAHLLPQLNAEGSYSGSHRLQNQSEVIAGPTGFVPTPLRNQQTLRDATWDVSLSQPLFDIPSWFTFKSGKAVSAQAQAQLAFEQQELIIRVTDAYVTVLRKQDNVMSSRTEELAYKEQFEQAQARMRSGIAAITDVDQAKAALDGSVAQRVTDEGDLEAAYAGLTQLTGQLHSQIDRLTPAFPVTAPQPNQFDTWQKQALDNNYALKAAFYAMEAAEENASSKQAEHLPKVTGSLSYQQDNVSGSQVVSPTTPFLNPPNTESHTKMAMVKITLPIFSSGMTSAAAHQAYAQYNTALDQRIDTERTVTLETHKRFVAANTDIERISARQQAIDSAQRALEATQAGYKSGIRSIVDVLTTQRTLFISKRDYANARYDYVMDVLHLKEQTGQLNPRDIDDLNTWLATPDAPTARQYSRE